MNNIVTIERNKLFKSKFDSCKGDLKATFKVVNQLLNKANCSKFPSHTNEKTQGKVIFFETSFESLTVLQKTFLNIFKHSVFFGKIHL